MASVRTFVRQFNVVNIWLQIKVALPQGRRFIEGLPEGASEIPSLFAKWQL